MHRRPVFVRLVDRTLPTTDSDHAAHLTVRRVVPDRPVDALPFLRTSIRAHDDATGVTGSATAGCDETITEHVVGAVASRQARSIDELSAADECHRAAVLTHWTRERLLSPTARWVDLDLTALP